MNLNQISIVFPGQGSQYVGMLSSYLDNFPSVQETFEEASKLLNINFIDLLTKGTKEDLAKTKITQPLMLIADVALWKLISNLLNKPMCVAGHSLGEYAALVAAEVLSFESALILVQERSELMQQAVPDNEGGIAAIIGLDEEVINHICSEISKDSKLLVSAANLNSSNQIVISGTKLGVIEAIERFKSLGAKRAISLPMTVPAHCMLMKSASEKFSLVLEKVEFKKPNIPVIHNFDSQPENDTQVIKTKLIKQIYSPVRWLDTINLMRDMNVKTIIECGPSKVLCGLIKRISPEIEIIDLDNYKNYLVLSNG